MTVEYDIEKLIVCCDSLTDALCEVVQHLDLTDEQRQRLRIELSGVSGAIDEFLHLIEED